MYNLANIISSLRILLSVLLLFTEPLSPLFFIVFILCGISDVVDGYVARTFGLESDFGAKLDSLADIIFVFCFLITIFPLLDLSYWMILWIVCIVLIKIIVILFGFMKFGEIPLIHTYLNKITGVGLILLPFFLLLNSSDIFIIILSLMATFAVLEELIILISSQNLDLNQKSILS